MTRLNRASLIAMVNSMFPAAALAVARVADKVVAVDHKEVLVNFIDSFSSQPINQSTVLPHHANIKAVVGEDLEITLAAAVPGAAETFTYAVSGLPTWLAFDAATRVLSGTPAQNSEGTHLISYIATGSDGRTHSDAIHIDVSAPALPDITIRYGVDDYASSATGKMRFVLNFPLAAAGAQLQIQYPAGFTPVDIYTSAYQTSGLGIWTKDDDARTLVFTVGSRAVPVTTYILLGTRS